MNKVNSQNVSDKKKLATAFILIGALVFIGSFGLSFWVDRILKIQSMQIPYKIFLGIFLTFFAVMYLVKNKKINIWRRGCIGVLAGQISGHLAFFIANFFIPYAGIKFLNGIRNFGFVDMLTIEAIGAFALGGWLLGLILFIIVPLALRKLDSE